MKRTPLKRGNLKAKLVQRQTPLKRTRMKRKPPKANERWRAKRQLVGDRDGWTCWCPCHPFLSMNLAGDATDCAHIIGLQRGGNRNADTLWNHPDMLVMLCRPCHAAIDQQGGQGHGFPVSALNRALSRLCGVTRVEMQLGKLSISFLRKSISKVRDMLGGQRLPVICPACESELEIWRGATALYCPTCTKEKYAVHDDGCECADCDIDPVHAST